MTYDEPKPIIHHKIAKWEKCDTDGSSKSKFLKRSSGGYLWSPKTRTDDARNQFFENMLEAANGDVTFSFWDTCIKAIGVAVGPAKTSPKPDFGSV